MVRTMRTLLSLLLLAALGCASAPPEPDYPVESPAPVALKARPALDGLSPTRVKIADLRTDLVELREMDSDVADLLREALVEVFGESPHIRLVGDDELAELLLSTRLVGWYTDGQHGIILHSARVEVLFVEVTSGRTFADAGHGRGRGLREERDADVHITNAKRRALRAAVRDTAERLLDIIEGRRRALARKGG